MASNPVISVVMPVYNGEAYVRGAIESILAQTLTDFEIVVVDDGSNDKTPQILASIEDERLRIFRHERNCGITQTRNRAMREARGAFIAVLDSDDYAEPSRLAEQLEFLKAHDDHAMVASWAEYVNADGSTKYGMPIWMLPLPSECAASILLFQNFICHSTVMLRASMLPDPVYRDLEPSEDYDLWVRLARHHKVAVLSKVLVKYRVHGQNVSKTRETRQQETSRIIVKNQLDRLGVETSEEELALHHKMFWDSNFHDRKALISIRHWLEKIRETNARTQVYEGGPLQQTIDYQWISACKRACARNPFMVVFCAVSSHGSGYRWTIIRKALRYLRRRASEMVARFSVFRKSEPMEIRVE